MSIAYETARDFLYREARYLDDKDWTAGWNCMPPTPPSGCRSGTTPTSSPKIRSGKSR